MRHLLFTLLATSLAALPAVAGPKEIVSTFGKADAAWGAQISPNGKYVALGCAPLGPPSVCIYSLTTYDKPKLFQVPKQTRLTNFYWAGTKNLIIEAGIYERFSTQQGFKDYTFERAISYNVETGNSEILLKKDANFFLYATWVPSVKPKEDNKIIMGLPDDRIVFYEVDLNSGKTKRLKTFPDEVAYAILDSEGNPVAEVHFGKGLDEYKFTGTNVTRGNGMSDFQVLDKDKNVVFEQRQIDEMPFSVLGLALDGKNLMVRGNVSEIYGIRTLDIKTGELKPVEIDNMDFSESESIRDYRTNKIVGFYGVDDLLEQYFIDEELYEIHTKLEASFPNKSVTISSWSDDRSVLTVGVEAPGLPKEYYLFDAKQNALNPLASNAPTADGLKLGSVQKVSYSAADGLEIPAYLTLPPGKTKADGPFPMILMPHGGPESRDTAAYDWWTQAYAAAGYAVLQPNFRGSTGYGAKFRNKGYGEFGGKMITDVLDGYTWAEKEGIARKGGYCLAGASYGGYAALQGAVLGGDDVKCAIAISAVGDPLSHVRMLPDDSPVNRYWTRYLGFGRFATEEEKAKYIPVKNAGAVKAPLLVMHGKEDTTVKFEQARLIQTTFQGRSDFRFVEMPGEDHYLQSTQARTAVLTESLNFLQTHFPATAGE